MTTNQLIVERPLTSKKTDTGIIVAIILLLGFGLFTLYISSASYGLRQFDDELYFYKRQCISVLIGLVFLVVAACIDLDLVRKLMPIIFFVTIIVAFLPLTPLGDERNGARRWISIRPLGSFQPSELVKLTTVLFLANLFDKKKDRMTDVKAVVAPAGLGLLMLTFFVFVQKDFSTGMFIVLLGGVLFFLAGIQIRWFVGFVIIAIAVFLIVVFSEPFRVNRLIAFLKPEYDVQGINYQLRASRQAINAGGFWGQGFGIGLKKVQMIPEVQSDFVFAGWVEAMGLFGVLCYFAILGFFAYKTFSIALKCNDLFRSLIAFGCGILIVGQSIMNCGVVCGGFPSTGIPLPFFSSGGSSILVTLIACGLLINVSRYENCAELFYE